MAVPITIPDLGTNVDAVTLVKWLKREGDPVGLGEALCEVETDKAVSEMESFAEGVLLRRLAEEGAEVAAGAVIAYVGDAGETPPEGRVHRASAGARNETDRAARRGDGRPAHAPTGADAARKTKPKLRLSRDGTLSPEGTPTAAGDYSREFLLHLYGKMVLIRTFEDRVKYLFLQGIMPGTIHQCQGQEACAVGVCAALRPEDVITSTHRPHGHCIARDLGVEEMMCELFGKITGCCRGKGGSMHMGDLARGIVPAVAIVGGGVPIATGAALAFRMRGEPRLAVSFCGDGAANEGAFHEGVNMGAIWGLPVLYVIENNLYGASTHVSRVFRTATIAERAAAYGIPGVRVDGNDVLAVYEATCEAAERARSGGGPTLLELMTYRITGHSRRDPALYQPEQERTEALDNEPIGRFARQLLALGVAEQADLDAVAARAADEVEHAVAAAQAAPEPRGEDALTDLFVE